ncbi:hypothetical protein ACHAQD_007332 [Fusarium lateritium]
MQQWLNTEPEVALPDHPHSPSMTPPVPDQPAAGDSVYAVGNILELNLNVDANSDSEATTIQVKVKKQQRPWTLSCGMMVEIQRAPENLPSLSAGDEVFLKMFDRRFAEEIREQNKIDPWCKEIEHEFARGLASGRIEEFLEKLRTVPNFEADTEGDWDEAEVEAFLASELQKYFNSETETYKRLREYQGKDVPHFFASVTLDEPVSDVVLTAEQQNLHQHKGVLLQYLPGYSLSGMIDNAPRTSWQGIVDQAVQKVHIFGDHDILNQDVRPDNFMVVPENGTYRVFLIDFGSCIFRREDETDKEWGQAKQTRDEEGAASMIIGGRLRKVGFELQYEPSPRYQEWARGEFD